MHTPADNSPAIHPDQAVNPGDEAAPGTPGSGEDTCRHCRGRGVMENGSQCPMCGGTGLVIEGIGGG
ncbi:DnaJ-class molecular chaperone [Janthinobacterium sp. CG_23.3]|uniref:hypothetical protein n=1 Tax=unclassified Janthinobacterium TaxID=2610881 RepID=UPI0003493E81|nr:MULTISPECIES: hypothetical protein [unclassified Janthinobacterium]MEC5160545.1 DnaJ-class molecular chaperone [Janthinobacterium sp. CG_S6]